MIAERSWVEGAVGSLWGIDNLAYGVFSTSALSARVGVRIAEFVLDLGGALVRQDLRDLVRGSSLDVLLAAGPAAWRAVRSAAVEALSDSAQHARVEPHLHPLDGVTLHLPFTVADYVDFYASEEHASNVGRIFRPTAPPLQANWKHLPVGYHGRAGSVVVSGTSVVRPFGQRLTPGTDAPNWGPSLRLDIEAELGFVIGTPSTRGERVGVDDALDHVFGVVGVNDWSARDIQSWEYVPLGPFLGKSFATSVSAWVTPISALRHAFVPAPEQHPEPLPYLREAGAGALDIGVEVAIAGEVVTRPPYRGMYWTPAQMIAHTTSNGAALRSGDLLASGTISGRTSGEVGSLLELSWGGSRPWSLKGRDRTFLEDGDEVVLRYTAPGEFGPIELGEVRGTVLAAC